MADIPLTNLVVSILGDNRQIITALKEVEAAKEKALKGDGDSGLLKELEKLGAAAQEANRRLEPVEAQARAVAKEMQNLATAIKVGAASLNESIARYKSLEATLKSQVAMLDKTGKGYADLAKVERAASEEGKRLEAINKSLNASYKADDLTRYARGLTDVVQAERAGATSKRDAITQLKSYQSALAQQTGALDKNTAEYRTAIKVMGDTGTAIRKLEADTDKLEASFRSNYLRLYAGEFRQIDAAVKSGTSGFGEAAVRVEKLTTELRSQGAQLGTTGREFDQFSRLLQAAATQQERYQRAAEQASRAQDASQLRAYTTELKQLEAGLQDAVVQLGRLDSQQRAIRYDPSGLRNYRTETEGLSRSQAESLGTLQRVGQGLDDLKRKLQEAAQSAGTGSRGYADLERLLQGVERATVSAAQATERSQQAYRSADIQGFATRLREIETAQRANVISEEQAARAVQQVQAEFREYAAALGVTGRELDTFSRAQLDAGRGADTFASAQERAARVFDSGALRSFVTELQDAVRAYQLGETGAAEFTRAVTDSQARLREYGSTLDQNSREFADLNRVLELSERALLEMSSAAERGGKGFDPAPFVPTRVSWRVCRRSGVSWVQPSPELRASCRSSTPRYVTRAPPPTSAPANSLRYRM